MFSSKLLTLAVAHTCDRSTEKQTKESVLTGCCFGYIPLLQCRIREGEFPLLSEELKLDHSRFQTYFRMLVEALFQMLVPHLRAQISNSSSDEDFCFRICVSFVKEPLVLRDMSFVVGIVVGRDVRPTQPSLLNDVFCSQCESLRKIDLDLK